MYIVIYIFKVKPSPRGRLPGALMKRPLHSRDGEVLDCPSFRSMR